MSHSRFPLGQDPDVTSQQFAVSSTGREIQKEQEASHYRQQDESQTRHSLG